MLKCQGFWSQYDFYFILTEFDFHFSIMLHSGFETSLVRKLAFIFLAIFFLPCCHLRLFSVFREDKILFFTLMGCGAHASSFSFSWIMTDYPISWPITISY